MRERLNLPLLWCCTLGWARFSTASRRRHTLSVALHGRWGVGAVFESVALHGRWGVGALSDDVARFAKVVATPYLSRCKTMCVEKIFRRRDGTR